MESKYTIYKSCKIHYSIYGSGKAVMLIHGFGEDSTIWEAQIDFLQNKYLLIVPDLPGSGKSEMLQNENVEMAEFATVMKAILEQEKITTCCMLGHSMGGYITLAFAEKYPEALNALGLAHSSAYAYNEAKKVIRKKAIKFIAENGSNAFLKASIPNLFYDTITSKEDIDALIEKGANFLPEVLIQYYHAMITRTDKTAILSTFSKPVLFIIGLYDQVVPFTKSMEQTHLPSISYIHIMRKSAHMSLIEEREKCNKILGEFLQY